MPTVMTFSFLASGHLERVREFTNRTQVHQKDRILSPNDDGGCD
jgi:hypothetical protein